ncbi:OLC1v1038603C1 [Oldenlandia corymbosa var. corymbosa]|uniref:2-oxoglutarate-dependent dioxygenase DAO n=1 Tax=Oldenlandia corymbosa var. corymbosa TaxID=529605 RepID=A0AAV1D2G7_OLDCO|nr:OLC1v1038603C1 [Oldenlandia corymbosa var. corymbosa]
MASQKAPNLPIIDISKAKRTSGTPSWLESCATIRHALEEYGCFLALYDEIASKLKNEVFDLARELFDLPLETKIKNTRNMIDGYIGQLPNAPLHESTGITEATTDEGVEYFTNLMWPTGNDRFRNAISSYAKLVGELENLLNKMVFESYGAGKYIEQHIESTTCVLRLFSYKPFQEGLENGEIGTNIHTDKGFLSIIHQKGVNGLRVQTRDGQWIHVDFPPDSFVIMAGDAYEAWSNGRIYSAKHQVIMTGDQPRYSVILFSFKEGTVEIPEEVVDEEHPLQYKPFENMELLQYYYSGTPSDMSGSAAKSFCGITA